MRTQSLKVLPLKPRVGQYIDIHPLKPRVGQYIDIHATLTAGDFFLAYFYPSGPFT